MTLPKAIIYTIDGFKVIVCSYARDLFHMLIRTLRMQSDVWIKDMDIISHHSFNRCNCNCSETLKEICHMISGKLKVFHKIAIPIEMIEVNASNARLCILEISRDRCGRGSNKVRTIEAYNRKAKLNDSNALEINIQRPKNCLLTLFQILDVKYMMDSSLNNRNNSMGNRLDIYKKCLKEISREIANKGALPSDISQRCCHKSRDKLTQGWFDYPRIMDICIHHKFNAKEIADLIKHIASVDPMQPDPVGCIKSRCSSLVSPNRCQKENKKSPCKKSPKKHNYMKYCLTEDIPVVCSSSSSASASESPISSEKESSCDSIIICSKKTPIKTKHKKCPCKTTSRICVCHKPKNLSTVETQTNFLNPTETQTDFSVLRKSQFPKSSRFNEPWTSIMHQNDDIYLNDSQYNQDIDELDEGEFDFDPYNENYDENIYEDFLQQSEMMENYPENIMENDYEDEEIQNASVYDIQNYSTRISPQASRFSKGNSNRVSNKISMGRPSNLSIRQRSTSQPISQVKTKSFKLIQNPILDYSGNNIYKEESPLSNMIVIDHFPHNESGKSNRKSKKSKKSKKSNLKKYASDSNLMKILKDNDKNNSNNFHKQPKVKVESVQTDVNASVSATGSIQPLTIPQAETSSQTVPPHLLTTNSSNSCSSIPRYYAIRRPPPSPTLINTNNANNHSLHDQELAQQQPQPHTTTTTTTNHFSSVIVDSTDWIAHHLSSNNSNGENDWSFYPINNNPSYIQYYDAPLSPSIRNVTVSNNQQSIKCSVPGCHNPASPSLSPVPGTLPTTTNVCCSPEKCLSRLSSIVNIGRQILQSNQSPPPPMTYQNLHNAIYGPCHLITNSPPFTQSFYQSDPLPIQQLSPLVNESMYLSALSDPQRQFSTMAPTTATPSNYNFPIVPQKSLIQNLPTSMLYPKPESSLFINPPSQLPSLKQFYEACQSIHATQSLHNQALQQPSEFIYPPPSSIRTESIRPSARTNISSFYKYSLTDPMFSSYYSLPCTNHLAELSRENERSTTNKVFSLLNPPKQTSQFKAGSFAPSLQLDNQNPQKSAIKLPSLNSHFFQSKYSNLQNPQNFLSKSQPPSYYTNIQLPYHENSFNQMSLPPDLSNSPCGHTFQVPLSLCPVAGCKNITTTGSPPCLTNTSPSSPNSLINSPYIDEDFTGINISPSSYKSKPFSIKPTQEFNNLMLEEILSQSYVGLDNNTLRQSENNINISRKSILTQKEVDGGILTVFEEFEANENGEPTGKSYTKVSTLSHSSLGEISNIPKESSKKSQMKISFDNNPDSKKSKGNLAQDSTSYRPSEKIAESERLKSDVYYDAEQFSNHSGNSEQATVRYTNGSVYHTAKQSDKASVNENGSFNSEIPARESSPKPNVNSEIPDRESSPKPNVNSEIPDRESSPKPNINSEIPDRESSPKPNINSEIPDRESSPKPNINSEIPDRESSPKPNFNSQNNTDILRKQTAKVEEVKVEVFPDTHQVEINYKKRSRNKNPTLNESTSHLIRFDKSSDTVYYDLKKNTNDNKSKIQTASQTMLAKDMERSQIFNRNPPDSFVFETSIHKDISVTSLQKNPKIRVPIKSCNAEQTTFHTLDPSNLDNFNNSYYLGVKRDSYHKYPTVIRNVSSSYKMLSSNGSLDSCLENIAKEHLISINNSASCNFINTPFQFLDLNDFSCAPKIFSLKSKGRESLSSLICLDSKLSYSTPELFFIKTYNYASSYSLASFSMDSCDFLTDPEPCLHPICTLDFLSLNQLVISSYKLFFDPITHQNLNRCSYSLQRGSTKQKRLSKLFKSFKYSPKFREPLLNEQKIKKSGIKSFFSSDIRIKITKFIRKCQMISKSQSNTPSSKYLSKQSSRSMVILPEVEDFSTVITSSNSVETQTKLNLLETFNNYPSSYRSWENLLTQQHSFEKSKIKRSRSDPECFNSSSKPCKLFNQIGLDSRRTSNYQLKQLCNKIYNQIQIKHNKLVNPVKLKNSKEQPISNEYSSKEAKFNYNFNDSSQLDLSQININSSTFKLIANALYYLQNIQNSVTNNNPSDVSKCFHYNYNKTLDSVSSLKSCSTINDADTIASENSHESPMEIDENHPSNNCRNFGDSLSAFQLK